MPENPSDEANLRRKSLSRVTCTSTITGATYGEPCQWREFLWQAPSLALPPVSLLLIVIALPSLFHSLDAKKRGEVFKGTT